MFPNVAAWAWIQDNQPTENTVGCFAQIFDVGRRDNPVNLRISAVTRYAAYLNGQELGRGPIRSTPEAGWYDEYELTPLLTQGENLLTVRCWDYGWSTYQSIAAPPGVLFEITSGETILAASGERTRAHRDAGHKYNVPKRNVNLGFMESYDARHFSQDWLYNPACSRDWAFAIPAAGSPRMLGPRPFPNYSTTFQRPLRVVSCDETNRGCQQVTVNTRHAFFPERRDANETIFAAFLGVVVNSPAQMEGVIAFPNRTWNGIIGDFCISGKHYAVSNANRTIAVTLEKGRQLFLLQISGKYDDLYCHMEFQFAQELCFEGLDESCAESFFVVRPTEIIQPQVDGKSTVYGGLDEMNRMPSHTPLHEEIFCCATAQELSKYKKHIQYVKNNYVLYDEYLFSLARTESVARAIPVTDKLGGVLWGNSTPAILAPPRKGEFVRLIVDFGDIYVGAFEFSLRAASGTVLDIYCFENMYGGEIDFTVGLNNGLRYVCAEGYQTYRGMTRMGCRFAMLTLRNQNTETAIYSFGIHSATYPPSNRGSFSCSDPLLNRIWEISRHTHTQCMEDVFTDCPTYEQAFWVGDAQISANVNLYLHGEYALIRHCLKLATTASRNTPLCNALTPTDWDTAIPMWTMNWVLALDQYAYSSGDEALIEELYPDLKKVMDTYAGFITDTGAFLVNAWNMLDWAAMDIHNHGVVTGQQAVLAHCFNLCAGFAKKTGHLQDEQDWTALHDRLLSYIDGSLWDPQLKMYKDGWSPEAGDSKTVSIQTHALLLYFDAILDPAKKELVETYVENPPEIFVKAGSPFLLFYIYQLWSARGRFQEVLDDIKQRWGMMLRYDSTTCWEVFPGFYEVSRTRSYCQSWSSIPVCFLNKYLLGVEEAAPSFDNVRIRLPQTGLSWCEGRIPTPHGDISVRWSKESDQNIYHISAPKAVRISPAKDFNWKISVHTID